MKIEGKVIASYPAKCGNYLGMEYKNQNFVIATTEKHEGVNYGDRIVVKVKGKNLEDFLAAGVDKGKDAYVFDLYFDAEERTDKDGVAYPVNKAVVVGGVERIRS